jgi:hypothetical protein
MFLLYFTFAESASHNLGLDFFGSVCRNSSMFRSSDLKCCIKIKSDGWTRSQNTIGATYWDVCDREDMKAIEQPCFTWKVRLPNTT